MSRLLPLFPLQLVVFPGNATPLHIFEERYKLMVGEAEAARTEFGIVLSKEGGVVNAGCTVTVETVLQRYPDGRFDIVTRGQRRFVIRSLNNDLAYLQGEVEFFDDDDAEPVPPALRSRALEAFDHLRSSMAALGQDLESTGFDHDTPYLSFQLASHLDDLDFQSQFLRNRSESDRLKKFAAFAVEYLERQTYAARMKKAAPTNGFGHKHPGE